MSFRKDNRAYEAWLAKQCKVIKKDIKYKHDRMKESAFIFLRATYFRWAKQIGKLCPDLMDAPKVLSVGDLHLENFGTWRDADGRLVWGGRRIRFSTCMANSFFGASPPIPARSNSPTSADRRSRSLFWKRWGSTWRRFMPPVRRAPRRWRPISGSGRAAGSPPPRRRRRQRSSGILGSGGTDQSFRSRSAGVSLV